MFTLPPLPQVILDLQALADEFPDRIGKEPDSDRCSYYRDPLGPDDQPLYDQATPSCIVGELFTGYGMTRDYLIQEDTDRRKRDYNYGVGVHDLLHLLLEDDIAQGHAPPDLDQIEHFLSAAQGEQDRGIRWSDAVRTARKALAVSLARA